MRHLIPFDFIHIWSMLKHGIIKSIGTMKSVVSIVNNQIILTSNIKKIQEGLLTYAIAIYTRLPFPEVIRAP